MLTIREIGGERFSRPIYATRVLAVTQSYVETAFHSSGDVRRRGLVEYRATRRADDPSAGHGGHDRHPEVPSAKLRGEHGGLSTHPRDQPQHRPLFFIGSSAPIDERFNALEGVARDHHPHQRRLRSRA